MMLGDIKYGKELGHKCNTAHIWAACVDCGKERWAILYKDAPQSLRCGSCSAKRRIHGKGKDCHSWRGGRARDGKGYIRIKLTPDDFFFSLTSWRLSIKLSDLFSIPLHLIPLW